MSRSPAGVLAAAGAALRAVDGVNLDVFAAEIVALVGEFGYAKTTLARTLLGLERPAASEIRYGKEPVPIAAGRLGSTAGSCS